MEAAEGSPPFPVVWFWGLLLLYAPLYFGAPMPPLPTGPGEPDIQWNRLQVAFLAALELPTLLGNLTGEPGDPFGMLDRVPILVITALILAVAYAMGGVVLVWLGLFRRLDWGEHLAFSLAIGLTLLSTWVLLVGLAGWLHFPLAVTLPLVVFLILAGRTWKRQMLFSVTPGTESAHPEKQGQVDADENNSTGENQRSDPATDTGLGRYWWLYLVLPAAFVVGAGMLPPYEYDVIEYHAQVPKEWYAAGQITHLPHNVYSGLPMAAEVWSLLPMIYLPGDDAWFTGTLVGQTILALLLPLLALLLWSAGRRLFGAVAGQVAAISCLATPWLITVSVQGLVDGAWAFFTLAALYPMLTLLTPQRPRPAKDPQASEPTEWPLGWILLSGLMAGMAVAIKYPALPLCAVPASAMLGWRYRTDLPTIGKTQALFWVAVLLVCGPWLAKNWVQTGNPVFPLAGSHFPTDIRTPEAIAQWDQAHKVPADGAGNRYHPLQLFQAVTSLLYESHWTMFLFVPLGAMAWVGRRRRMAWILLGLILFHFAIWWLLSHRLERFWLPLFPLACLLTGLGGAEIAAASRRWGRVTLQVVCGLAVAVGLLLLLIPPISKIDPRMLVSIQALRASQESSRSPAIGHLNEALSADQTVLATGDSAPFYFRVPVLYHTCFDPSPLRPLLPLDAEGRRAWLTERNVTHVYVHWGEIARFRSPGNYGFPAEVTPELFEELRQQEVLGEPTFSLGDPDDPRVVVYPVRVNPN